MNNLQEIKILIAEDHPNDAELTLWTFQKHNLTNAIHRVQDGEGARVIAFRRGNYAGNNFLKPLKVIFLDLKLPKISGLEVLAELKSNPEIKILPILILSSSHEDIDIKTAYELGVNSYLVNPVNFIDFLLPIRPTGLYRMTVNETIN